MKGKKGAARKDTVHETLFSFCLFSVFGGLLLKSHQNFELCFQLVQFLVPVLGIGFTLVLLRQEKQLRDCKSPTAKKQKYK